MSLILKILSFNGQPYPGSTEVIIDEQGGTIGRADTNTLVLADENKIISRRHAILEFDNGHYSLTDSSLGGTFIDQAIEPIHNTSVQLADGMQIKIGDYIIACNIIEQSNPFLSPAQDNPFADEPANDLPRKNELAGVSDNDYDNPFLADTGSQDFSADLLTSTENNSDAGLLNDFENNDLLNQQGLDYYQTSDLEPNHLLDSGANADSQPNQSLMDENGSFLNDSFTPASPIQDNAILDDSGIPEDFNFEDLFNMEGNESDSYAPAAPSAKASASSIQEQSILANEPAEEAIQSNGMNQGIPEHLLGEQGQTDPKPSTGVEINSDDSANAAPINPVPNQMASSQASLADTNQLIQAFLRGAQMESETVDFANPVEKMTRIGRMFRQFVESTVDVLRNRAEFKSLFRVNVTTIQRIDNNPLKFAVTTNDAVKHLINDDQVGFKESVESIDEGFNDLLNHQLAMQAGIQASLNDILRQFDPEKIEKQYEEGIVLQKKSKCWDKYTQTYKKLSETAVEDFFGDAFSEAYEKQMKQLKK